jgi:TIR domain
MVNRTAPRKVGAGDAAFALVVPDSPRLEMLDDYPEDVQQLAGWLGEYFARTGLWPRQTDTWREIARRGLVPEPIIQAGGQIFAYLNSSPRDAEVVELRPWALFDTGHAREAFERAYGVFKNVNGRLRSEESVRVTRAEIAQQFSLPVDGKELHQTIWVLYSTFGGAWSKTNTSGDWDQEFGVGALRNPVRSLEDQFLHRPHSWRHGGEIGSSLPRPRSVPSKPPKRSRLKKGWDLFLSHASEDKRFVGQLVAALKEAGLKVWYDSHELTLGDSLAEKIDEGLTKSRYGIVVLSPAFLRKKHWTRKELDGLVEKEVDGRKAILPIWHGLDQKELRKRSPILAGRLAAKSADGLEAVVNAILAVAKPTPPQKPKPPGTARGGRSPAQSLAVSPATGEHGKGHYLPVSLSTIVEGETFEITIGDFYRVEIHRAAGPSANGQWHGRLLGGHVFNSSWVRNAAIYGAIETAISVELDRCRR